jgi:Ca2+-binding RTX toxin-like protein
MPDSGYLWAQIPVPGTPDYFTAETRRIEGIDEGVPGEAVVIHRVHTEPWYHGLVVTSEEGNDVNGPEAMWVPGETFVDAETGISIAVNEGSNGAFRVTVDYPNPACTIRGTQRDDRLHVTQNNDVICGLQGNDRIVGRSRGSDLVVGGPGIDTLVFDASGPVEADLGLGIARFPDWQTALPQRAMLVDIENLVGSFWSDTLVGDDGENVLDGGDSGDDRLVGGGGDDDLQGGWGRDYLDGGPGNDRLDGGPESDTCLQGAGRGPISECERA